MKQKIAGFFKKARQKFSTADRLTAFLAMCLVAVSLVTVVPAQASSTEVDSNLGGMDLSISRFSEVVAQSFSSVMSQALPIKNMAHKYVKAMTNGGGTGTSWVFTLSNIGNIFGYAGGTDGAADVGNVWTSGFDASSRVMTLETIHGFYTTTDSSGAAVFDMDEVAGSPFTQYIMWGSALNSMGIDEFRDAQSASDGVRMVIGYAAYIFYILAYTASDIMNKVVSLMVDFNIFSLFWNAGFEAMNGFTTKFFSTSGLTNAPLIEKNVKPVIEAMKPLRWVILGIMALFVVASMTVWKSKAYGQAATVQERWRRLAYRIIIMCIGIPLCGVVYTELLGVIQATASKNEYKINQYIFQEFLDFEGWTTKNTEHAFGFINSDTIDAGMMSFTVRYDSALQSFEIVTTSSDPGGGEVALDVNKLVYSINEGIHGESVTGSAKDATYVGKLFNIKSSDEIDYSKLLDPAGGASDRDPDEGYDVCRNLLLNYARSNTVMADTLNNAFLFDLAQLGNALLDVGNDNQDKVIANNAAIEQLFGEDSADQRIWSYVRITQPWIYPKDATNREIIMGEGSDKEIRITLKNIALTPWAGHTSDGIIVESADGGPVAIMGRTLNVSKYDPTTGVIITSGNDRLKVSSATVTPKAGTDDGYIYEYKFDIKTGGMSPLALYNYMHSKFENGSITVYSPGNTTNAGVSMMHYAVTTPYSGIPEIVQLLFVVCMLFSVGIIGWVFGVSLLMNTVVQMLKAIPIIFKMMIGSVQGFVEGLLIVISVAAELLVTVTLYSWSLNIIDFVIKLLRETVRVVLSIFSGTGGHIADPESTAVLSGLLSSLAILWATFQLIKWRRAITISIKSVITHVLNQVFGTSAQMPTGANSGMMKAAGALAAGAMIAGEMADQGVLDDVINDFTDSDLGSSLHDKIKEGDYDGALQDIKDYASGNYEGHRGSSETSEAEQALRDADARIGGAFSAQQQSLTDDQHAEEEPLNQEIQDAEAAYQEALENGDEEAQQEALDNLEGKLTERTQQRAKWKAENAAKAKELGVSDYGDYLRAQASGAGGQAPIEGADIPEKPMMDGEEATLEPDAQAAYTAAHDGDGETLRSMSAKFDEQGLDAEDQAYVNDMVLNGASEEEVAEEIANRAKENFGDDYQAVVDKMNEAAGRGSTATYGDNDPTDGRDARTMSVQKVNGEDGLPQLGVTDNSDGSQVLVDINEDGSASAVKDGTFLPEEPNTQLDAAALQAYQAVAQNDTEAMAKAAGNYTSWGGTQQQAQVIAQMVANNASAAEVAAACNNFAQDNFGDNYAQVVQGLNQAAGRVGETTQISGMGADGVVRSMDLQMNIGSGGNVSYKAGETGKQQQTVTVQDSGGVSTYQSSSTGLGGAFGVGAKGETIVTTDFGSGQGAPGSTYGEIRVGADAIALNSGNKLVQVGHTDGGGSSQLGASEVAVTLAAQNAMRTSGQQVTGMSMGDVNYRTITTHVGAVDSLLQMGPQDPGQGQVPVTTQPSDDGQGGSQGGGWNTVGAAGNLSMMRRTYDQFQEFISEDDGTSGNYTDPGSGDGGEGDDGTVW